MKRRIVLVHAVTVAIEPVHATFRDRWPDAELVNLLDDSLARDLAEAGDLTPGMHARFAALTCYALDIGADGILFTCSAFGEAIDAARAGAPVPVLKPNEAMFLDALEQGERIGMLATFEPSVASMEADFRAVAGGKAVLRTICVPEAMRALHAGDADTHDQLLAQAAPSLRDCDALMLAQFSTSRASCAVAAAVGCPVLTSPGSAVERLRALVAPGYSGNPALRFLSHAP
ncbi:MAG: aspartate/glutamate racemase family protein [Gammaproteobacteria bacterium]|nr:aspartate/glutamate racemase family protein [Gammaproteobacteria bacterium]